MIGEVDPFTVQISGDHYKDYAIQPAKYVHANRIPYLEGSVIYYVTRWREKGGIKDLEKAIHTLQLLLKLEQETKPSIARDLEALQALLPTVKTINKDLDLKNLPEEIPDN